MWLQCQLRNSCKASHYHKKTSIHWKLLKKIWEINFNESHKVLEHSEEKRDSPDISVCEEVTIKEIQLKCAYWNCQFNSKDTIDLENHIKVKHVVDESFKYPDSTEEIKCLHFDLVFMADHNFTRHVYQKHFYSFACKHCHKHLPGDDEMVGIHYTMCSSPCDGHRFCPCKFWPKIL